MCDTCNLATANEFAQANVCTHERHLWKFNDIMVDIEVPACCYTKMELFNEAHVVCVSISFVFDELYAKTRVRNVLLPKGPHRSVLPVAALKPVLSCS